MVHVLLVLMIQFLLVNGVRRVLGALEVLAVSDNVTQSFEALHEQEAVLLILDHLFELALKPQLNDLTIDALISKDLFSTLLQLLLIDIELVFIDLVVLSS